MQNHNNSWCFAGFYISKYWNIYLAWSENIVLLCETQMFNASGLAVFYLNLSDILATQIFFIWLFFKSVFQGLIWLASRQ